MICLFLCHYIFIWTDSQKLLNPPTLPHPTAFRLSEDTLAAEFAFQLRLSAYHCEFCCFFTGGCFGCLLLRPWTSQTQTLCKFTAYHIPQQNNTCSYTDFAFALSDSKVQPSCLVCAGRISVFQDMAPGNDRWHQRRCFNAKVGSLKKHRRIDGMCLLARSVKCGKLMSN